MHRVVDDFDRNYVLDPDRGCWLWVRAYDGQGRGTLRYQGGTLGAHVVAWIRRHGQAPAPGMVLISRCRVHKCCNPDHHYVGTRGEAWHAAQRKEIWQPMRNATADGSRGSLLATRVEAA